MERAELSREMRLLDKSWKSGQGWPKRLESIRIEGLRGWTGQRVDFKFPITAIVGENGVGKSTVLQCVASSYRGQQKKETKYPTDFFPETQWDEITKPRIEYSTREGPKLSSGSLAKLKRWRGYSERPVRDVQYIDLRRIQPLSARPGYWTLAKKLALKQYRETSSKEFEPDRLARLKRVMARDYESAKFLRTEADSRRDVPILSLRGRQFSAFHHGAGEATMHELLRGDLPRNSLVLVDEAEASLHARVQRRLIRELADICRHDHIQVVLTTHSPVILEELPDDARVCIMEPASGGRSIVYGVSPELAMTKMDDVRHFECEVFVEDIRAAVLFTEIMTSARPELMRTTSVIPSGAASVCQQLGQMVAHRRWPRPVAVFLDGDQPPAEGCYKLPGDDAPERVVFEALRKKRWVGVAERIGRQASVVIDQCDRAMSSAHAHEWVAAAANGMCVGGDVLWQALCSIWVQSILPKNEAQRIADSILSTIEGDLPPKIAVAVEQPAPEVATPAPEPAAAEPVAAETAKKPVKKKKDASSEPSPLFERSAAAASSSKPRP
jgi:predicted ATPase